MSNRIIVVSPKGVGGVRDYSEHLVAGLGNNCQLVTWAGGDLSENISLVKPVSVIVQYSGYGYAKRGAPVRFLEDILKLRPNIKSIGVYFHELYAFGPIWSSAFWLSPLQRHVARRLVEICDFWLTNREASARWLRRSAANKPHVVLPVFSNVGELDSLIDERERKVVVFGGPGIRARAYQTLGRDFIKSLIEKSFEVHDIGPEISNPLLLQDIRNLGVFIHGKLPQIEVSQHLASSMIGILDYPIDYIGKSGVFAAYCAHGVCPLVVGSCADNLDALVPGVHYIKDKESLLGPHDATYAVGNAAWQWYQPHRKAAHISSIQSFLK